MATNPLHKYTVAESNNLQVYEDYTVGEVTLTTSYQTIFENTSSPAKQVILANSGAATIEASDVIHIVLNNKDESAAANVILIGGDSLPFTIDNLLITKVEVKNSDVDADEELSCIAFQ